ncbi:MAG: DUF2071 domain-containing protein [Lapillicoccus sp.]
MSGPPTSPDSALVAAGPPLPTRQIMSQWWREICFAHWGVDPDRIAALLPRGVRPDLHEGRAWVGLIPFRMVDAGVGRGPAVPFLGTFLEMNVRTYTVDDQGHRGVAFLSLEAQRALVVLAARGLFNVPYQWARMRYAEGSTPDGRRTLRYTSRRLLTRTTPAPASIMEVAVGDVIQDPAPRDLFLTARFGLHTSLLGQTLWIPNTHGPWPLRQAELLQLDHSLVAAAGLGDLVDGRPPDSVLHSAGVRTTFGLPQRLRIRPARG